MMSKLCGEINRYSVARGVGQGMCSMGMWLNLIGSDTCQRHSLCHRGTPLRVLTVKQKFRTDDVEVVW